MTGRNHREEFNRRMTDLIEHQQRAIPTASLGKIKTLDESQRRAEIETVPDGNPLSNVPVAAPLAGDGYGDLAPLNPSENDTPVHGIVLYTHHPLDRQLSGAGEIYDEEREHEEENAIFLPAQIWFDNDAIPDHEPDDRVIDHPSGGRVRINDERVELGHEDWGFSIEQISEEDEEEDLWDDFKADQDYWAEIGEEPPKPDNTTWPIANEGETAEQITHPSGIAVTVTDRGVAIEVDEATNDVAVGAFTSGERRPLDGAYQHTHLLETADGPMLVGEHLTFREWVMWLTTRRDELTNSSEPWVAEASIYAEAYLDWLEDEMGGAIDPSDPDDWPDPEPMPTPDEKEEFH